MIASLRAVWHNSRIYKLRERGILGMNARNICYISKYNQRHLYPLVDDKLKTKKLALANKVNVPDLIGVIENQHDIKLVRQFIHNSEGLCIKPAKGAGGKGILVLLKNAEGQITKTNGQPVDIEEVERHISNILAGLFSLGGKMDVAVIETLIEVDDSLRKYTYEGVPDLRVIVFRGVPVMAMMRLSCTASKGKANLHQGAVGVGIHIATGKACNAVYKGECISHHPDTNESLEALLVAEWDAMLTLACACYDMTGLGYLGVDLVLDKHRGPLCLELNARPGLSIQIANNAGLLPRLRAVEQQEALESRPITDRLVFAKEQIAVL